MKTAIKSNSVLIFVLFFIGLGVAVSSPCFGSTLTYQISGSTDDAAAVSGESLYGTQTLYVPYSDSSRRAFWRWRLEAPKGATITSAYLYLKSTGSAADGNNSAAALHLVDSDNCPSFWAGSTFNLPVTGTPITWTIPGDWRSNGGNNGDGWYKSTDVKSLVQAFINRTGYKYGNYIGIRAVNASGSWKSAYQFDGGAGAKLEINYTGGEARVELWMAEPHVRIKQKIYVQLGNLDATDTLTVTLDGNTIYQSTPGFANGEVVVLADYRNLTAGGHTLTASVKTVGGTTRGAASKTWTTLHNGYPKVGIDENNALCLRNQGGTGCDLFFPITAFMVNKDNFYRCGPTLCSKFIPVINALNTEGWYASHTIFTWKDYLDKAWTEDRDQYHDKPRWYGLGPTRGEFDGGGIDKAANNKSNCVSPSSAVDCSYVNYSKNHPALLGWMWGDEPDLNGWTPRLMKDWLDATHNNDTDHPVFTQFYGYDWTTGKMGPWSFLYNEGLFDGTKTVLTDVTGMDYYVYEFATWSRSGVPVSLEDYVESMDRNIAYNYNLLPGIFFIEPQDEADCSGQGPLRGGAVCGHCPINRAWTPDPSYEQLKNNLWISVIHGSKGLHYFGPDLFCATLDYEISCLKEFKTAIDQLKDIILQGTSTKANHSGQGGWWLPAVVSNNGRVDYTVRDYQGRTWIFAARVPKRSEGWPNGNIPPVTATFTLSGLTGTSTLNVYAEGRTVTATNGSWSDTFAGFDVHIYYTDSATNEGTLSPPKNFRVVQ